MSSDLTGLSAKPTPASRCTDSSSSRGGIRNCNQ
jgi:hypothetical protein